MVRRYALNLLLAVAVFFVSGEILARTLNVVDRLNGYHRILFMRGPDVDLPYLLRPGIVTTAFSILVRVNRFGFRGPDITPEPLPGVRRVLVMGDSVVFGNALREEETLSVQLERALDSTTSLRWETVNAGVQGYDTTAEARLLGRVRTLVHPDVIVVGFSLNDYDVAPMYSPLGFLVHKDLGDRKPRWYERSEFVALLRWLLGYTHGSLLYQIVSKVEADRQGAAPGPTPRLLSLEQFTERTHLAFYRHPLPAYLDRMRAAFAELRTAAAGRRLLVAIFPEAYQIEKPEPDLTPQRRVLELCHEAGVPCLDLQPAFAAAGGELFLDTQHPNARGHEVAAGAIAAALRGEGGPAPPSGDVS